MSHLRCCGDDTVAPCKPPSLKRNSSLKRTATQRETRGCSIIQILTQAKYVICTYNIQVILRKPQLDDPGVIRSMGQFSSDFTNEVVLDINWSWTGDLSSDSGCSIFLNVGFSGQEQSKGFRMIRHPGSLFRVCWVALSLLMLAYDVVTMLAWKRSVFKAFVAYFCTGDFFFGMYDMAKAWLFQDSIGQTMSFVKELDNSKRALGSFGPNLGPPQRSIGSAQVDLKWILSRNTCFLFVCLLFLKSMKYYVVVFPELLLDSAISMAATNGRKSTQRIPLRFIGLEESLMTTVLSWIVRLVTLCPKPLSSV